MLPARSRAARREQRRPDGSTVTQQDAQQRRRQADGGQANDADGAIAGLHAANALFIFWVSLQLVDRVRAPRQA